MAIPHEMSAADADRVNKVQTSSRIPELDGLRAISIGFVLLLHLTYGRLSGGFLGVDIFFVLSGYLITGLLMKERAATGRVSLRDFYVRRALRIVPPLIIVALLGLALAPIGTGGAGDDARRIPAVLLFYANLQPPEVMGNLVHTWSLAIEEQFYLVWPALLLLALRLHPVAPVGVAAAVIVATVLTRYLLIGAVSDATFIYRFTFTHLDGIMLGCLLALAEKPLARALTGLSPAATAAVAWSSAALLVAALVLVTMTFMLMEPLGFLAFDLVAATFLFSCTRVGPCDWLGRVLRCRLAQWLGSRSYGLYLYHYPIFIALEAQRVPGNLGNFAVLALLKLMLSFAFTELAWRCIEQPVLGLKARFAAGITPSAVGAQDLSGPAQAVSRATD